MTSLKGKTLFVSGGSRGIGLAIALRAARDGANVAIAAKTAEPQPKLKGTIYTAADEVRAAGGADFVSGGVDGALELRLRLGGLGGDRDIGAIARGAQRDRQSDPAAATGHEQRLAFERCHGSSLRGPLADC